MINTPDYSKTPNRARRTNIENPQPPNSPRELSHCTLSDVKPPVVVPMRSKLNSTTPSGQCSSALATRSSMAAGRLMDVAPWAPLATCYEPRAGAARVPTRYLGSVRVGGATSSGKR